MVQLVSVDAVFTEALQFQARGPLREQLDQRLPGVLAVVERFSAEDAGGRGVLVERVAVRCARLQRLDVDARAGRDQRAAHHAVRDRVEGAQRRGQAVHRAESALRQRDAGQQRGIGHARACRRHVLRAVFVPGQQAVAHRLEAADGQGIGEGIGAQRHEGLQQLGERVHAVGGDDGRRAARQQVGVDHGVLRHQLVIAERFLEAVRALHAQHGVLGGLAAGARGGGHGDQRHGRALVGQFRSDPLEVVHDALLHAQQAGDGLGGVQCAAAADAQHHVDLGAGIFRDDAVDQLR